MNPILCQNAGERYDVFSAFYISFSGHSLELFCHSILPSLAGNSRPKKKQEVVFSSGCCGKRFVAMDTLPGHSWACDTSGRWFWSPASAPASQTGPTSLPAKTQQEYQSKRCVGGREVSRNWENKKTQEYIPIKKSREWEEGEEKLGEQNGWCSICCSEECGQIGLQETAQEMSRNLETWMKRRVTHLCGITWWVCAFYWTKLQKKDHRRFFVLSCTQPRASSLSQLTSFALARSQWRTKENLHNLPWTTFSESLTP